MHTEAFIDDVTRRYADLESRARAAFAKLGPDGINAAGAGEWTPGQILRHLVMANQKYLDNMESAVATATRGDSPLKHTLAGKMLVKVSRPEANTPAPKFLQPEPGPYTETILDAFVSQLQRATAIAESARGANLTATKFKNPYAGWLPMNLFDPFEILAVHGERHVRQVEERAAR